MCGSLRFSHHEPTILKRFCETTHSFPLIFKSTQMVFIGLSGWTIYMLIQINRHFCKRHIQRKREIDDCMKIQWTGSKLFLLNVWAGNMCYTFQLSFVFEVEDHSRIYAINTNLVDFFADINFHYLIEEFESQSFKRHDEQIRLFVLIHNCLLTTATMFVDVAERMLISFNSFS